jgi:hypothetical protein
MINAQNLNAEDVILKTDLFTPEAMCRVGKAFSSSLKQNWADTQRAQGPERYGLIGPSDSGKSVFVSGMLSVLETKTLEDISERPFKDKIRLQKLLEFRDVGFIRITDAELTHIGKRLSADENDFLKSSQAHCIDIVENAQLDYDEAGFSAVWQFNHNANAKRRELVLYASPAFRAEADIESFKNDLALIKAEMP